MSLASVTRLQNSIVEPTTADALAVAIVQQRAHILTLERIVTEARDAVVRAGAELDASVRARDRAIWEFEQLDELAALAE